MYIQKKIFLILVILLLQITLYAVNENKDKNDTTKYWSKKTFVHVGFNASILTNWTAGGNSYLSIQSMGKFDLDYDKNKSKFTNELNLVYALVSGHGKLLSKQADIIQLESEYNYLLKGKTHLTFLTHGTTQFAPGYIYSEDPTSGAEVRTLVSEFMSPALTHEAAGINFIGEFYEVAVAPLGLKQTIVLNSDISPAFYGLGPNDGKLKNQIGLYINSGINLELINKKLSLDADLVAFADYNDIGVVDILFKYLVNYKVTKFLSVHNSLFLIYDDDIGRPKLVDTNGDNIPDTISSADKAVQIKQALGVGVSLMF